MTSEEIIERLIEEKHITVKEAMIIMKDLAKESVSRMFYPKNDTLLRDSIYYSPYDWKNTIDTTKIEEDNLITADKTSV